MSSLCEYLACPDSITEWGPLLRSRFLAFLSTLEDATSAVRKSRLMLRTLWCSFNVLFYTCSSLACASGWTLHNGYCYQLRGRTSATATIWTSARRDCRQSPNVFLVSILSSHEQEFIRGLIQNTVNFTNVQSVFIGLSSRTSRGGYVWSDGSPVSYTHWKPGFVTELGKQCVSMGTAGQGYWNDRNCDDASAYICKAKQGN